MNIIVMKFGGSSLATTERIKHVAQRIVSRCQAGQRVAVVVSAMGDTTDKFVQLAHEITPRPSCRELDVLLTAGEQVSISLLAMAIQELGAEAVSLTGRQAGFHTDGCHANADLLEVKPQRVLSELSAGRICVVAGFQGLSAAGEITSLGRGGSDTSAVALAVALEAERCEIYSDVEGVYSADPRKVANAALLGELDYDEMLELARHGAQVLKPEAVELARRFGLTLCARSTFSEAPGTLVRGLKRDRNLRGRVVGVTGRDNLLRLHLREQQAPPDLSQRIAECDLLYSDPAADGFGLVVSTENLGNAEAFVDELTRDFADCLRVSAGHGAVSAVGGSVGESAQVGLKMYDRLRHERVDCSGSYLSPHSVTCMVAGDCVERAVAILHESLVVQS